MVCMLALTASLATRVSHARVSAKTSVTSNNPVAKFQRLDRDGLQWVAPDEQRNLPSLPIAALTLPSDCTNHFTIRAGDQFYNRPPPIV